MVTDAPGPTAAVLFAAARSRLAGSPREALGDWAASRRLLGLGRAPRIVRVGEAWHLGVLLLTDDAVYATGEVLRARREAVRGYTAQSQRERSERAAAAFRGGFAEGEVVHVGWQEVDVAAVDAGGASGPLLGEVVSDGHRDRDGGGHEPHVRWSTSGATRPLAAYLDEQLTLLR